MQDRYEANAKRLITTWGGWQEDYAARYWTGLVSDYYLPRLELWFDTGDQALLDKWEEKWIQTPYNCTPEPFADPIEAAKRLLSETE